MSKKNKAPKSASHVPEGCSEKNNVLSRKHGQTNTFPLPLVVELQSDAAPKTLRFAQHPWRKKKIQKKQITRPPQDKLRASVVILCIKLANLNSADTDGKKIIITDMVWNVGGKRLVPARP